MNVELKKEEGFEYVEKGEGQVLLALHGLFGALSNFSELLEFFSKKMKVVIPLQPIYSLPIIKTDIKNLAIFINDFIKFKKYDKINLLGNSLGGHVALVYGVSHLTKLNSLILTGSSGLYENAFGGSYPRRGDKEFLRKKIAVTFYDPKHATDELVDECYNLVNDKGKLIRILALAKSAIRHNMAKELPNIHVPTCLIWGKNDNITPPNVAKEFNKQMPDSELFWLDKCGHAPMMEYPEIFNNILDNWFNKRFTRIN